MLVVFIPCLTSREEIRLDSSVLKHKVESVSNVKSKTIISFQDNEISIYVASINIFNGN